MTISEQLPINGYLNEICTHPESLSYKSIYKPTLTTFFLYIKDMSPLMDEYVFHYWRI